MKSSFFSIRFASLLALGIAAGCSPLSGPGVGDFSPHYESALKILAPPEIGEYPGLSSMTDAVARDMLDNLKPDPGISPPVILVDAEHFLDRKSDVADKRRIVDRLRRNLNHAADGRLIFVDPLYFQALEKREETRKDAAKTESALSARADYRLEGTVALFDAPLPETGETGVLYRFVFQLIGTEDRAILWSGAYGFREKPPEDLVERRTDRP